MPAASALLGPTPSIVQRLLTGSEAEADQSAGEMEEREHRGSVTIKAHSQAAIGEHPRIRPFDDPPVSTEPLTRLDAATCDPTPLQGTSLQDAKS